MIDIGLPAGGPSPFLPLCNADMTNAIPTDSAISQLRQCAGSLYQGKHVVKPFLEEISIEHCP
jgi:hypothetical protein